MSATGLIIKGNWYWQHDLNWVHGKSYGMNPNLTWPIKWNWNNLDFAKTTMNFITQCHNVKGESTNGHSSELYLLMSDLFFQIADGQYTTYLLTLLNYASNHVFQCELCLQRGFICQMCHSNEIIFPFQFDTTTRCVKSLLFIKVCISHYKN